MLLATHIMDEWLRKQATTTHPAVPAQPVATPGDIVAKAAPSIAVEPPMRAHSPWCRTPPWLKWLAPRYPYQTRKWTQARVNAAAKLRARRTKRPATASSHRAPLPARRGQTWAAPYPDTRERQSPPSPHPKMAPPPKRRCHLLQLPAPAECERHFLPSQRVVGCLLRVFPTRWCANHCTYFTVPLR